MQFFVRANIPFLDNMAVFLDYRMRHACTFTSNKAADIDGTDGAGKQHTMLNADAPPCRVVRNVIANFRSMKNVAISPT